MQQGVAMWEAAGFLGMTQETLEKVYGHHHPDYLATPPGPFRDCPRDAGATPANSRVSCRLPKPVCSNFKDMHLATISEGKGHTFESCRVRQ